MLAVYTRLSREDDDSNSIDNQIREGKSYASLYGYEKNYEIYNEGEGISGTLGADKRPEFYRLINDIESGKITHIWMRKQDRLARSGFIVINFIEVVIKNNVKLFFGDRGLIDFSIPTEKFQIVLYAAIDELKPSEQSASTKKSIRNNFEDGKTHGKSTYGYTKDDNRTIIIHDIEADIVRSIFMLSLNGMSTQKIANELNKRKVETQYNKLGNDIKVKNKFYKVKNKYTNKIITKSKSNVNWKAGTIYSMLTNTSYKGMRKSGKRDNLKYYSIPIIIEPHIWEKVNDNLTKNSHNKGNQPTKDYLLKGLIRCGKCGNNFYGRARDDKSDNFYMCSSKRTPANNCGNRSINIDFLDNLIWERLASEDGIQSKINNYFNNNESQIKIDILKTELETLNKSLESFNNQKKNTIRYADEGTLIDEIITEINNDIAKAKNNRDIKYKEMITLQQIVENRNDYINDLKSLKDELPLSEKLSIVRKYIQEIQILDSFSDRDAYSVLIKLQLDAELNEMHIINHYYKYRIDVSNKTTYLLSNKLNRLNLEQQEIQKQLIYDDFVIDVNIPADTLEDLEDLYLNQLENQ